MDNLRDFSDLFLKEGEFHEDDEEDEADLLTSNGTATVRFCLAIEAQTKEKVICKVFDPLPLSENLVTDEVVQEYSWYRQLMLLREALILNELEHPAIVKFKGLNLYNTEIKFDADNKDSYPNPVIYLECLKNKSIESHIRRYVLNLPPVKRQICIIGISAAISFLHKRHVLHRSINPKTIWLDENFYPKIFDFSTSRQFNAEQDRPRTILVDESVYYKAPELFEKDYNTYNDEIDVFSLGRMIYLLVTGVEPFKHEKDPERTKSSFKLQYDIIHHEAKPFFPDNMSSNFIELLKKCFDVTPLNRPSASDIYDAISKKEGYLIDGINSDEDLQEIKDYIHSIEQFEKDHPISDKFFYYKLQI